MNTVVSYCFTEVYAGSATFDLLRMVSYGTTVVAYSFAIMLSGSTVDTFALVLYVSNITPYGSVFQWY